MFFVNLRVLEKCLLQLKPEVKKKNQTQSKSKVEKNDCRAATKKE